MTKVNNYKIPKSEIEILTAHVLKKPKEFLITHPDFELSESQKKKFNTLFERRVNHEPLAYILGKKEFFGLEFKVDKNVLIPRPETEHLVEEALKSIKLLKKKEIIIHEMATGSGAVIISLVHELKKSGKKKIQFEASDISKKALKIAKENAKNILGKTSPIKFSKKDILNSKIKTVDVLISNPPYIESKNIKKLERTVKDFEPKIALDGGEDGLKYYKALLRMASEIKPQIILLELESPNAEKIKNVGNDFLMDYKAEIIKDLAGRKRVLKLSSPSLL